MRLGPSVLFVRCVPLPSALDALRNLREASPHARVDVLTSRTAIPQIEASGLAEAIVPFDGSRFSLRQAGAGLLLSMRRRRYDTVVVPTTSPGPDAFWNVALIALLCGGTRTVWQLPDRTSPGNLGEWPLISFRAWWRRRTLLIHLRMALYRALQLPVLAVSWLLAMVLLTVIAGALIPLVWLKPGPSR